MWLFTFKPVNVPNEVTFVCAAVVKVPPTNSKDPVKPFIVLL